MISWILREMEKEPTVEFFQKELEDRDATVFAKLRLEKLLVTVPLDEQNETHGFGRTEPLTIVKVAGKLYGINEQDPEADSILLSRSDAMRYKFSVERFIKHLAEANGFSGLPKKLHHRMYYAGESKIGDGRFTLVLAFVDQEKTAEDLLLGLPGRLSIRFKQYYVVTPSYIVQSLELKERLERELIQVIPLQDFNSLKIDLPFLAKEGTTLTPQEKEECRLYGFIYQIRIRITGEREGRASNFMRIGDRRIRIGDTPFALFLRLVLQLHHEKTGEISKQQLIADGYFKKDEDESQKIERLRQCFVNIAGIDPLELIKDENKSLKLSVHRSYISWDRDLLLTHKNADIIRLAEQLPQSPLGN